MENKKPLLKNKGFFIFNEFARIGFFIWVAENIATFYGAWKYPSQMNVWSRVHIGKWNSWSLLMIMTLIVVTHLKMINETISFRSADSKA